MMYDKNKSESLNLFYAINEEINLLKENNDLLKQMLAFWNRLEQQQEDYENAVVKDGIRLP